MACRRAPHSREAAWRQSWPRHPAEPWTCINHLPLVNISKKVKQCVTLYIHLCNKDASAGDKQHHWLTGQAWPTPAPTPCPPPSAHTSCSQPPVVASNHHGWLLCHKTLVTVEGQQCTQYLHIATQHSVCACRHASYHRKQIGGHGGCRRKHAAGAAAADILLRHLLRVRQRCQSRGRRELQLKGRLQGRQQYAHYRAHATPCCTWLQALAHCYAAPQRTEKYIDCLLLGASP